MLDTTHPTFEYLVDEARFEATRRLALRFADGGLLERVVESRAVDFERQILALRMRYRLTDAGGAVRRESAEELVLRWINPAEMRLLLELSGLRVLAEHADFTGRSAAGPADRLWVVAAAGG